MKLTFLGTGSAFTVGDNNFQSNLLLQSPSGKNLLIDCGGDVRHSLHACGFTSTDIDAVYVSHLHSDHVGGLEWLGFTNKFNHRHSKKPVLFIHRDLSDDIWNKVLQGGLSSLKDEEACLNSYFDVKEVNKNFTWENISFELVKTVHYFSNHQLMPSYGLQFTLNKTNIFLTTDTCFSPQLLESNYSSADLIFHDCETSLYKSGYHSTYEELMQLNPEIKRKMWLYHYQPGNLPDAKAQGFKGFAVKGQTFNF